MIRRFSALAALAVLAGSANAQDSKFDLSQADGQIFSDIREGKKLVKSPNAAEAKKNEEVIRKKAQVEIARFLRAAETSNGTGAGGVESVPDYIRSFTLGTLVDPQNPVRVLKEGQVDLARILGDEMLKQLKPLIGSKEKPSGADMVVKLNSVRLISIIARSGYDGAGNAAVEIINDPQHHDAIKLYALEALNNLFSVPNPDRADRSMFLNPDDELRAVTTVIGFIARKPAIAPNTPREEIDAYKFVRREAVRALGKVRKPAYREGTSGVVAANPAVWLLRVAAADKTLVPPPSLNERVEGLAGYLGLMPDKEQNMDFAAGFVALTIKDLTLDYKERKPLEKSRGEEKPTEYSPLERDYHPWKVTATRISVGLKVWYENWNDPVLGARPADVRQMMAGLVKTAEEDILGHMVEGNKTAEIKLQGLEDWLRNTKFPSAALLPNDPSATIVRP